MAFQLYVGFAFFAAWDMLFWWLEKDDYGFGFIVPFFIGYVILERWPHFRAFFFGPQQGDEVLPWPEDSPWSQRLDAIGPLLTGLAYLGFLGGLLAYLASATIRAAQGPNTPTSFGLALGIAAITLAGAYIFSERDAYGNKMPANRRYRLACWLLFPALVWLVSCPLLGPISTTLNLLLMEKVAITVVTFFEFFGMPIERAGNIIRLPKGDVGVAEACSGIRSLTACLFAGSFLGAVFLDRLWKKVLMVATAMFFAFFNNLLRSLFLTFWAYMHGSEAIDEVHDTAGWVVLGLTCVMLIALLPIFNWKGFTHPDDDDLDGGEAEPSGAMPSAGSSTD